VRWLLVVWLAGCGASLKEGDPARPLDLYDPAGKQLRLQELRGRPVIVDFFASWCHPCRQMLPQVAKIVQDHPEVVLVIVDVREPAAYVDALFRRNQPPPNTRILIDEKGWTGEDWGVRGIPTTFVLDHLGVVRFIGRGATPNAAEELRAAVDSVVAARPAATE
jgi:thiol-disulfide isomerase/thioredoxin